MTPSDPVRIIDWQVVNAIVVQIAGALADLGVTVEEWNLANPETTLLGQNIGIETVFDIEPVIQNAAYAANDVLCATIQIPNAVLTPGGSCLLHSLTLLDKADQGAEIEIYILRSNVSLGAVNGPITITDADAEEILAVIPIAQADYHDLVNSQIANAGDQKAIGMTLIAAPGSTSLWLSMVTRGTPTYVSTSDLFIHLGLVY